MDHARRRAREARGPARRGLAARGPQARGRGPRGDRRLDLRARDRPPVAGADLTVGRRPLRADRGARDPVGRSHRQGDLRKAADDAQRRPRRAEARRRLEGARSRSCRGPPSASAPATSRSPASARGARRSRSSTARRAGRCRWRWSSSRCACPRISPSARTATRCSTGRTSWTPRARRAAAPPARGGHARLPLRRRLPAVSAPGPDGRPRVVAAHPPRAAALGAGGALHQRCRHRQLRPRPADDLEDAARPRPLHLAAGRRVLPVDVHARDGAARRAQDEQAPRQHRGAARDRRALRGRHAAARHAPRGRAREGVHLGREPALLLQRLPAQAVGVRRAAPSAARRACRRRWNRRRAAPAPRGLVRHRGAKTTENYERLDMHRATRN